jgi:integrative and conjugative element protein (TIGR02256 family)
VLTAINDVRYSKQVVQLISSQIEKFGVTETGGTLLGYVKEDVLYVDKASDPGPNAIHESIYFKADANYIDMFIDMEIANSNGRLRYIGEWHTHPQIKPYPSSKDFISLTEIADSSEDFVLMLIVGEVKFTLDRFFEQHIVIIKHRHDGGFYKY